MGRDFVFYYEDPEAKDLPRDDCGYTISPEEQGLDFGVSRYNRFLPGGSEGGVHYDKDELIWKIKEWTDLLLDEETPEEDHPDLLESIKVIAALLIKMGSRSDVWIEYA